MLDWLPTDSCNIFSNLNTNIEYRSSSFGTKKYQDEENYTYTYFGFTYCETFSACVLSTRVILPVGESVSKYVFAAGAISRRKIENATVTSKYFKKRSVGTNKIVPDSLGTVLRIFFCVHSTLGLFFSKINYRHRPVCK